MIPVIYRGDDTDFLGAEGFSVRIEMAEGLDLTGCTVEVSVLGTVHKYPVSGTGALVCPFVFSAKDTASMPLGVHCAKVRIIDTAGRVRTIMDTVRVKVVDTVAEAYGEGSEHELKIELSKGAALPAIPEELRATDGDSLGEVKEKMNQVLDLIGGGK